jgi:hypothetical protein
MPRTKAKNAPATSQASAAAASISQALTYVHLAAYLLNVAKQHHVAALQRGVSLRHHRCGAAMFAQPVYEGTNTMTCCRIPSFVILMATLLPTVASASPPASPPPLDSAKETPHRLREGEVLEVTGKLELAGDRAIFYPAGEKNGLRVLENLALERVTQVLSESRDERQWIVSGTITEYRGANYILIHKAVQRALGGTIAK